MDSLEYSNDALSAKSLFYNRKVSVFVEGIDDRLFWDHLFLIANVDVHVEDVNGKPEIDKLIQEIYENNAEFYVAIDSHHSAFLDDKLNHPQIFKTYGYSIENSMYNSASIELIISRLSRKRVNLDSTLNEWMAEFVKSTHSLLIYDIANEKYGKGICIFGKSSVRFLKSSHSPYISEQKITAFLNSQKDQFSKKEISSTKKLLPKCLK